jgi:hypothetical protein
MFLARCAWDDPPFLKTATLMSCTSLLVGSPPAIAYTGPDESVGTLGNEALDVIRADTTPTQKKKLFTGCCKRISTFQA